MKKNKINLINNSNFDEYNFKITELEDSKKGNKTLLVRKEKKMYFHSKYDPNREAEKLVESYDINGENFILFYGTGLGYHIGTVLEKYPNINYYICEPIEEIFHRFICNSKINLNKTNFHGGLIGNNVLNKELNRFLDIAGKKLLIIELPAHKAIFEEEYKKSLENIKKIMESKRDEVFVNYNFQERWIVNSIKNFPKVLSTPNILRERNGYFKGQTAVLVAAGPSLNYEIENLRKIKSDKSAYIFSVGSAINTLIYNDIYPDATLSYDPTSLNDIVLKRVKDFKIIDIPLIFGSSIGFESIEDYNGKLFNVITSQDSVSNYYLQDDLKEQVELVQDASTIAVITIQILKELGFSKIILVGQNLAYVGNKNHSEGVTYSVDITDEKLKNALVVKDVYGNYVYTSEGYNSMRKQIEYYIRIFNEVEFINTTKNGADIQGAKFEDLDKVMESMEENVTNSQWMDISNSEYGKEKLEFYKKKMDIEYKNAKIINKGYERILKKIEIAIDNKKYSDLENIYVALDKQFSKIENNDFYRVFILGMIRVEYKLLTDKIDSLNGILDVREKVMTIYKEYKSFLDLCIKTIDDIDGIYNDMNNDIEKYLEVSND